MSRADAPIIILTAKSEEVDRVVGLEIGVDDQVTNRSGFDNHILR